MPTDVTPAAPETAAELLGRVRRWMGHFRSVEVQGTVWACGPDCWRFSGDGESVDLACLPCGCPDGVPLVVTGSIEVETVTCRLVLRVRAWRAVEGTNA